MIAVRFRPVADRIRMWSAWTVAENPLLVGYVREDLLNWIAKTREGPTELKSGFRSHADAAAWILVESGFAQVPPKQQLELREAA
jgi:hypothetical protein